MTAAEDKAKKIVADAEAKAKEIIKKAEQEGQDLKDNIAKESEDRAKAIIEEAKSDAANIQAGPDTPDSTVNDKFNALWAQINEEYEDDTLRQTVLAQLEALQFAAKGLDD